MPARNRLWNFTYFNYADGQTKAIEAIECQWMIIQAEKTPETGVLHLQGGIYFKNPMTLSQVKELFPIDTNGGYPVHLEVAKGTAQQVLVYCTKLDTRATGVEAYTFHKGTKPIVCWLYSPY